MLETNCRKIRIFKTVMEFYISKSGILHLCLLCGISIFFSCSKNYYQFYNISSQNCKSDVNNFLIRENDSVKITYSFWGQGGVIAFTFANKLDKPVYIDWKKSSCVFNGFKINYWEDIMYSKQVSISISNDVYRVKPNLFDPSYLFTKYGLSANFTNTTSYKPEQITFLPPKSYISINKFSIKYSDSLSNADLAIENGVAIGKRERNSENSEFRFRNFISFYTDEKYETTAFIDDYFYISSIKEMRYSEDVANLAQPNLYYLKINDKTWGINPFIIGDKVIITESGKQYVAEVTSSYGYQTEDANSERRTGVTVEFIDKNGVKQTKEVKDINMLKSY